MRRRTLLALAPAARAWAQAAAFPGDHGPTLRRLAAAVLPSAVDAARVADQFAEHVRGWRAGAALEPGYGLPRLRAQAASPAAAYMTQLAELASLPPREAAEKALANVQSLPASTGANVVADLLSFYLRSAEANDLCYERAIGRDKCRGLKGSENPPERLK